ncbi:EPIDERMAL PATTERNING FACTOR-like protein 2 isoform X2 [Hibiscus syriacus]|uniref:EPIDERMAL PATTERNING FACTOR-like protein 2 isoform X2 n=1 Tax=Hibiscus syriacus TaxID=106335 RepID=UPI001924E4E0|nr:EPIDERMAL PATTERNING FACTOR-like protein 2 isoform X2 [Hibiscus syriacus]
MSRLNKRGRSNTMSFGEAVNEEKSRLRAQIGSRPPRCERRCNSCKRCEAVQVPTNPSRSSSSMLISVPDVAAYERGDANSNYKPMSWKCKCGNFIFNP